MGVKILNVAITPNHVTVSQSVSVTVTATENNWGGVRDSFADWLDIKNKFTNWQALKNW